MWQGILGLSVLWESKFKLAPYVGFSFLAISNENVAINSSVWTVRIDGWGSSRRVIFSAT